MSRLQFTLITIALGLSLMTLIAIRDSGRKQPAGGILIAPWVDLSDNYILKVITGEHRPSSLT